MSEFDAQQEPRGELSPLTSLSPEGIGSVLLAAGGATISESGEIWITSESESLNITDTLGLLEDPQNQLRGLTLFDDSIHADAGSYPKISSDREFPGVAKEGGYRIVESFNARLSHLEQKIATFTRVIDEEEYMLRVVLFTYDPEVYSKYQFERLKTNEKLV